MATAKQICDFSKKIMKKGCALITGADFSGDTIERLQLYFWYEEEAVMDVISKSELLTHWPLEGVFVINESGKEGDCVIPVRIYSCDNGHFLRSVSEDKAQDDIGEIPSVVFLESIELICQL